MRRFPAYAGVILTWPQRRPTFQLTPLLRVLFFQGIPREQLRRSFSCVYMSPLWYLTELWLAQTFPLKRELSKSVSSFLQHCIPALAVVILTVRTVWRASLLPRVCGGFPTIIRCIVGENKKFPCIRELSMFSGVKTPYPAYAGVIQCDGANTGFRVGYPAYAGVILEKKNHRYLGAFPRLCGGCLIGVTTTQQMIKLSAYAEVIQS